MNFDDYAKNWDTEMRINRAKKIADEIVKALELDEEYSAMEFGCGTGLISFNLFNHFKKVTLVDSSEGMINIANSKIKRYGVSNMVATLTDISEGNTMDEKFDVIYSSMVLHHIPNIPGILEHFYKLLNPEGYLCIVDLDEEDGSFHKEDPGFDGHNGFNQDNLKGLLANAGYSDIESKTFYHDIRNIGDEKVNYSLFLMKSRKKS